MADYIIGLTGGVGSGKTTVANLFADLGIIIVDADIVARQVVEKGSVGLSQICDKFGREVLNPDGSLNRSQLRELIFSDPTKRKLVNNILHPLINNKMDQELKLAHSPYAIRVVPLLFENGIDKQVQRTLVVDTSEALQSKRTALRDKVPLQQVQQIINSQMSRQERLAKADDIILNQGDIEDLQHEVNVLHNKYLALSKQEDC